MAMLGRPKIDIKFRQQANVAGIAEAPTGILCLVFDDSINQSRVMTYSNLAEIDPADYDTLNFDLFKLAFASNLFKLVVTTFDSAIDETFVDAMDRVKFVEYEYVALCRGTDDTDYQSFASFIQDLYDNKGKKVSGIITSTIVDADHEAIINFVTPNGSSIETNLIGPSGSALITPDYYVARIAGIVTACPESQSITYRNVNDIVAVELFEDEDTITNEGKIFICFDGYNHKMSRGVTSFTTVEITKGEPFQKIRLVRAMMMIDKSIRRTFNDNYIGKIPNSYNNKQLFISVINVYFNNLAERYVLDPAYESFALIDEDKHRALIIQAGEDPDTMSDLEIRKWDTGSYVYLRAYIRVLDVMEDLSFDIVLAQGGSL